MLEEILLHIGYEKTGTTAIQRFLARNRNALARQGVLYPVSPGDENHVLLPLSVTERDLPDLRAMCDDPDELLRLFAEIFPREIAASSCRRLILSSEHCSSRLVSDLELIRLKALLGRFSGKIKIVLYLRRQDRVATALYSTWVKSGWGEPFRLPSDAERLDWRPIVERWARIFGRDNLILRIFREPEEGGFDAVADFGAAADLDMSKLARGKFRANASLIGRPLEFLRRLNAFKARQADAAARQRRYELVLRLERMSGDERSLFDTQALARFHQTFEESNAALARDWFGRPDGRLFAPPPSGESAGPQIFSADDAVEIAQRLLFDPFDDED